MSEKSKILVGISCGDINGIGLEVILKTFEDKRMLDFCTPVIFASQNTVNAYKKLLNNQTPLYGISEIRKAHHQKVNVYNCWKEEAQIELGKATADGGKYAAKSLECAVKALQDGSVDVLLTAPINKETIQSERFNFPGHTEFLAHNFEGESLMILMQDNLRIGLITGHIPVSEVSQAIHPALIESKVNIMHRSLVEDFNINKPKIAVLALNPHSGDNGVIGREEIEVIGPTIKNIQESGKLVYGPYAADGFFGSKTYRQFDGVLAMYHDQGLAPFKSLSFGKGVNFTAGLSVVRTSPDHGTAFEIAGKNKANIDSFKEALFSALEIHRNRTEYKHLVENSLVQHNQD